MPGKSKAPIYNILFPNPINGIDQPRLRLFLLQTTCSDLLYYNNLRNVKPADGSPIRPLDNYCHYLAFNLTLSLFTGRVLNANPSFTTLFNLIQAGLVCQWSNGSILALNYQNYRHQYPAPWKTLVVKIETYVQLNHQ